MKLQSLLITLFGIATLSAQETATDPNPQASEAVKDPVGLTVCYEAFSVPTTMAATFQREQSADGVLYAKLLAALGKDSVRQETFTVTSGRSGLRATNESVTEVIYATEYSPARVSNAVTAAVPATDKDGGALPEAPVPTPGPVGIARMPATPTSFETRNTGFTFDMEATLGEDLRLVDISLNPGHVTLVGTSTAGQELNTTEMPIFESQRLNSSATVKIDEPFLLGTVNRPPGSKQDPDSANRVWFAFVTVTLTK